MRSVIAAVVVAVGSVLVSAPSWGCSAVGPNKHVGLLLEIDNAAGSFTVLDAQTNRPISFIADERILNELGNVKGQILVDFEAEGSKLRATGVEY